MKFLLRAPFDGAALPSGVYLYHLQAADPPGGAGDLARTRRMLLVK